MYAKRRDAHKIYRINNSSQILVMILLYNIGIPLIIHTFIIMFLISFSLYFQIITSLLNRLEFETKTSTENAKSSDC